MRLVHACVAGTHPVLTPPYGAIQRRILELSKAQVAMGHEVTVFSPGHANRRVSVHGISIRFVRCITPMPWRHAEYLARVYAHLAGARRPDVLNFHSEPEGVMIAKALSRPAVLFLDTYFLRRGWSTPLGHLYREMLHSFDLLLACSDYCLRETLAYWRLDGTRASVQYNGVNLSQFHPDPDAGTVERLRLGIRRPVVLYVGRVNRQKGSDILLESIAMVRSEIPQVTLVVAGPIGQFGVEGDAKQKESWTRKIVDVGGIYLGPIHEDRLTAVYNMADVFVMPSDHYETFCMAAVEAQACGIPVIASDVGALAETVPDRCGARFPVRDATALASALVRLLKDDELRKRCSVAAVENAQRYSWDRIALELESHYARAGFRG